MRTAGNKGRRHLGIRGKKITTRSGTRTKGIGRGCSIKNDQRAERMAWSLTWDVCLWIGRGGDDDCEFVENSFYCFPLLICCRGERSRGKKVVCSIRRALELGANALGLEVQRAYFRGPARNVIFDERTVGRGLKCFHLSSCWYIFKKK